MPEKAAGAVGEHGVVGFPSMEKGQLRPPRRRKRRRMEVAAPSLAPGGFFPH